MVHYLSDGAFGAELNKVRSISLLSWLNFLAIFLIAIWKPLQQFVLHVDGAGRTPLFFGLLVVLINYCSDVVFRRLLRQPPIWIWFIWILWTYVNTLSIGSNFASNQEFAANLLLPLIAMILTAYTALHHRGGTMLAVLLGLYGSCFILWLNSSTFVILNQFERIGSELINPNEFALTMTVAAYFLSLAAACRYIRSWAALLLSLPLFILIINTASRTAYFAIGSGLLVWAVSRLKSFSFGNIVRITVIVLALLWCNKKILSRTVVGQRFDYRLVEAQQMQMSDSLFARITGDRFIYYVEGWELFKDHPWRGIGTGNYIDYNLYGNLRCHVEYMTQLSEGGLPAMLIFLAFYASFAILFVQMLKKRSQQQLPFDLREIIVYASGIGLLLLINFSAYTSMKSLYYPIFGIFLAYIIRNGYDESADFTPDETPVNPKPHHTKSLFAKSF